MPDYNEILGSLKQTQGFFKRETQEYKDFRDALSKLSKAMHAAGNAPLSEAQVLSLRELTAKAREAWGKYSSTLEILCAAEQEVGGVVRNPLSRADRRRIQILNGMQIS